MTLDAGFNKLLSPLQVGPVRLKNRAVQPAHAMHFDWGAPYEPGDRHIEHFRRMARGGVAMITNGLEASPSAAFMPDRLKRAADAVHEHDCVLIQQLGGSAGAVYSRGNYFFEPYNHSISTLNGRQLPALGEPSHKMTSDEVQQVVDRYMDDAKAVLAAGWDGVELHAQHGTIEQQSFSTWGNGRDDKWGEPLYFISSVLKGLREVLGSKALLSLRWSVDDFLHPENGGLSTDQLIDLGRKLAHETPVDMIGIDVGSGLENYAIAIGNFRHPQGEFLPLAAELKAAVGPKVPVMGAMRIITPELAEKALQAGDCDLIAMGRAHLADPDLMSKVRSGNRSRIRKCTGANFCIDHFMRGSAVDCVQNPEVGREHLLGDLKPAAKAKRVLVVGGGPAGLKAAEIAAKRGHQVTLAERAAKLGGRLNLTEKMTAPPNALHDRLGVAEGPSGLMEVNRWLENELSHLSVEVKLDTDVDEEFIDRMAPDAIILATGAEPTRDLGCPSDGSVPILSSDEAALGNFKGHRIKPGKTQVLMVDRRNELESALVLESLLLRGCKVTYVSGSFYFGQYFGTTHRYDLQEAVFRDATVLMSTVPAEVKNGTVRLRRIMWNGHEPSDRGREVPVHTMTSTLEETRHRFDFIVAGSLPRARTELQASAERHARTRVIGDAWAPREVLEAIKEGDEAGRWV